MKILTDEIIERAAYRLIRIEFGRLGNTTDSELANYVRGVVDLQTQLYDELNKIESEEYHGNNTK